MKRNKVKLKVKITLEFFLEDLLFEKRVDFLNCVQMNLIDSRIYLLFVIIIKNLEKKSTRKQKIFFHFQVLLKYQVELFVSNIQLLLKYTEYSHCKYPKNIEIL